MDDTDVGPYDLVPPSPIAASAQMPRSIGQRVPPLPQLVISGTSQSDLSPAATSTQQPESSWPLFLSVSTSAQLERSGSLLSPLATSSQHLERSGTLLLPTATSTQQPENSRSVSPTQTRNLTPFQPSQIVSRQPGRLRAGARSLSDWVVRRPSGAENHETTATEQIPLQMQANPEETAEIDDDEDDDDIIRIDEADSDEDIVSTHSGGSEEVIDPDTRAGEFQRPESPPLAAGHTEAEEAELVEDNQNDGLAGQEAQGEDAVASSMLQIDLPANDQEQGAQNIVSGQETIPSISDSSDSAGPSSGTQTTTGPILSVQALFRQRESPADFRSPKRKRVISPFKSTVKEGTEAGDEDGECCPICFEPWTTSGCHRLSSLRCGHLFGQSCIDKWLKGQGGKCPHCNAKAKRQDIRVIYAKSVRALDTSERDRALKDLQKEKDSRRQVEMEAAELRLKYQMVVEDNNKLRVELEGLKQRLLIGGATSVVGGAKNISQRNPLEVLNSSHPAGRFMPDKTIKIWEAGNCRVMAYSPPLATIVVSQPSSSPLFPGFGVKKISALDFKTSQYLTVHSKAIRDISFHPNVDNGMLLSCGLDKKVKMTNLLSNAVVQCYDTPMPAWSCVWNADDRHYFYTGLQNGLVLEFDIRNTDSFVQEINSGSSRSPVAALKYIPRRLQATFSAGGLLIGQLDRVQFYESLPGNHYRPHILPLDGSLTSLYVDPSTRHVLASFRPTARNPTVRHQLCEMVCHYRNDSTCSCNVVYTFHGGKIQTVLSKTVLIKHPADCNRLLICAGDEGDSSVHVWDSGSGQRVQNLPMGGFTVDTCSLAFNQQTFLAALTEKRLNIFKFQY